MKGSASKAGNTFEIIDIQIPFIKKKIRYFYMWVPITVIFACRNNGKLRLNFVNKHF